MYFSLSLQEHCARCQCWLSNGQLAGKCAFKYTLFVAGQCLLMDIAVLIEFRILCRHQPELRINIHIQWAGPSWVSSPEPGPGIRPEPAKHPS